MDYIEICEWERFQHYKHRNPPWVKLYAAVLDDDDFDDMPDASKLLFFCLLPFASRRNNKIKLDYNWLQRKLPISGEITMKTIQPLIDAGFISCTQAASKTLDNCVHQKSRVEKSRDREEHLSVFDIARKRFFGSKNGLQVEFDNFCKKHPGWKNILPQLLPAVENQIIWRAVDGRYWKNFQTWINQSCWTEEAPASFQNPDDGFDHCQHPGCKKYWSKDDKRKLCKEHERDE